MCWAFVGFPQHIEKFSQHAAVCWYNPIMERNKLHAQVTRYANTAWEQLCDLRPALGRYNPPAIYFSGRLWRTAGRCWQGDRVVELGVKFFEHSPKYATIMRGIIIPHELIHQADFDLYGLSEKSCGHGDQWAKLMVEYGLPPNPYHSMDIPR